MEPFSPLVPPESGSGSKMPQNVFKYGAEPKKTKHSEQIEPVILILMMVQGKTSLEKVRSIKELVVSKAGSTRRTR